MLPFDPLKVSVVTDAGGDKHVLINGTDFTANIAAGGVAYQQDRGRDATLVTVTFVADEFSHITRHASERGGGVPTVNVTVDADAVRKALADFEATLRKAGRKGQA